MQLCAVTVTLYCRRSQALSRVSVKRSRCISHVCGCVAVLARAPKGIEVFWKEFCESDSPFCCSTDGFLRTLRKHYIHKVKAKQPGQADAGGTLCSVLMRPKNWIHRLL